MSRLAARILLMAKAPVPGQAKTRLIPALGEEGAAALARRLLDHAVAQAAAADLGPVTLWATPDATHEAFVHAQRSQGVALAVQPEGDIGARMAAAFSAEFEQHGPGPVLLMGCDIPDLGAAVLREAAAALRTHDAVFVPALDGGYALVGLNAPAPALFAPLAWSTPQVMAATRERLRAAGLHWAELAALPDIDEPADLRHLPVDWRAGEDPRPGRTCPLHYRYDAAEMARAAAAECEAFYVVGGLYGNEPALQQVLALFERERSPRKRLVFNGDFHWFDADPALFTRINEAVLQHDALRGNVETELAAPPFEAEAAGCGCGYPDWVGDGVVERSNRILARLRSAARAAPQAQRQLQALAALPMWRRVQVGRLRVAVVHGDAQSLAGWGFAVEHLREAGRAAQLQAWFEAAQVDAFACSHTCLPVFARLALARGGTGLVLNNGAAGMPNFRGDGAGLVTRIALSPFEGAQRRHGFVHRGVHVDAIAVDAATPAFKATFARLWPAGSDAQQSYGARIEAGPAHEPGQALLDLPLQAAP